MFYNVSSGAPDILMVSFSQKKTSKSFNYYMPRNSHAKLALYKRFSFLFLRIRASNVAHYFQTKKIIHFFFLTDSPVATGRETYFTRTEKSLSSPQPFTIYINI